MNPDPREILAAPDQALVCYCSGVSKGRIRRAMAQGARSLADMKAATGACSLARCSELSPRGR